jgi:hypothetical protein
MLPKKALSPYQGEHNRTSKSTLPSHFDTFSRQLLFPLSLASSTEYQIRCTGICYAHRFRSRVGGCPTLLWGWASDGAVLVSQQVSGEERDRVRPSSATWPTRSWASTPSSCPPVNWSLEMPESRLSSSVNVIVRRPTSSRRCASAWQSAATFL